VLLEDLLPDGRIGLERSEGVAAFGDQLLRFQIDAGKAFAEPGEPGVEIDIGGLKVRII